MKKRNAKIEPTTYNFSTNPYIHTTLDISTGHLTGKDNELLTEAGEGESGNPIVTYIYEYGYFVFVPEEDAGLNQHAETYGYSKAFTKIMARARELKCKYIQFDGDGIQYDDLDTFNW
jgi:hypothetical protein